jgi:hypothetical protein
MLLELEDEAEEDDRIDEEEDREGYTHEQVACLSPIQVLLLLLRIAHRGQLGCGEEDRDGEHRNLAKNEAPLEVALSLVID